MLKILKTFMISSILFCTVFIYNITEVQAASGTLSISAPSNITLGKNLLLQ